MSFLSIGMKRKLKAVLQRNKTISFLLDCRAVSKNKINKKIITELAHGVGQIFYFQNLGNLNPDKYIYLTGFSEGGVTLGGICGIIRKDLIELEYVEKFNLTPVIEYRESLLTEKKAINGTHNAFEYYYDQVSDVSVEDAWKSRNVCIQRNANVLCRDIPFGYDYTDEQIDRLARVYAKYFHLNSATEKQINDDMDHLLHGKRTLGINIRGTDFNRGYAGHPVTIHPEQLVPYIDDYLKEHNCNQLFIATDDQRFLDKFIEKYGDQLLYYKDVHREYEDEGTMVVDYMDQKEGVKYRGGYECLRDVYTLAKCTGMIAGFSGVEVVARIVKRANDEKFERCEIVSNGYYHSGKAVKHVNE